MKKNIFIIGGGGWGTANAIILNKNGHSCSVWIFEKESVEEINKTHLNKLFLPNVTIPSDIKFTSSFDKINDADVVISAVPTKFLRNAISSVVKFTDKLKSSLIVSLTKGIENDTFKRPSEIIQEITKSDRVAVLSGPSHAEEVAIGKPASVVVAARNESDACEIQNMYNSSTFRVYTQNDVIGVELANSLKNVIAIAAGICDGMELGDNAKSALIARGIIEMARFGEKLGANRNTFYGLAGIGDLITTCVSKHGRNRMVGERIGKGEKVNDILSNMKQVSEGAWTAKSIYDMLGKLDIDMPICNEVYQILYENKSPDKALDDLMNRIPKTEEL